MDLALREQVYEVLLDAADSLYSTAYRFTGRADVAEDAVQETVRKAIQNIAHLRDKRKIRAWLFKILVNCVRDHFRRLQEWEQFAREAEVCEPCDLSLISRSTAYDVERALGRLSPARRAVVLLVDIEDFTLAEAADMLGIPPGTAASRLARARDELRYVLRAYETRISEGGGPA